MRGQERIKLKRGTDEPMRARKATSMINSANQQILKTNKNDKSKEQSILDLTWKKSSTNTGISKYLSNITLNVNGLKSPKDIDCLIESKGKIQKSCP
jgi:hypothetical protein